jgi:hypothetical protein
MTKPPPDSPRDNPAPAHSTRFQQGQSGNPRGRPKARNDFAEIYAEVSNEKIVIVSNGKRQKVSTMKAMLLSLRQRGLNGDVRAMKQFIEFRKLFPRPQESPNDLTEAEYDEMFDGYDVNTLDKYREITAKELILRDRKRKRRTSDGTL